MDALAHRQPMLLLSDGIRRGIVSPLDEFLCAYEQPVRSSPGSPSLHGLRDASRLERMPPRRRSVPASFSFSPRHIHTHTNELSFAHSSFRFPTPPSFSLSLSRIPILTRVGPWRRHAVDGNRRVRRSHSARACGSCAAEERAREWSGSERELRADGIRVGWCRSAGSCAE
jgi:hypothetical protein